MDYVIPDVLHLILRIVEKQLQATVKDAQNDKQALETIRSVLGDIYGNPHFVLIEDGEVLRPRLTGGLVDAVLMRINEICVRREGESEAAFAMKQDLWALLKEIKELLYRDHLSQAEVKLLKDKIMVWGQKFVFRLGAADFPNSGHVLCMHVPYYLELYGSLARFSQQGFERLVGDLKAYARSCQSPQQDIPKGLLETDNRNLLFLEQEYQKTVVNDVCSYCKERGHRVTNKNCPQHQKYLEDKKKKGENS